ncbi:nucleotide exchange factor GrpE [bacterium]|nr:nucleotide exchange factor GrpE [bacterium]
MGDKGHDKQEFVVEEASEVGEEIGEEISQAQNKIKKLQHSLKMCDQARREELENLQRAKADFLNTKHRLEEAQSQIRTNVESDFIMKLLPIADSFHLAKSNDVVWDSVDKDWQKGFLAIENQLDKIFETHHVEVIDPLNEPFDPNTQEAVGSRSSDIESDAVLEVLQRGYRLNDRVLRPAKVVISE